MTDTTTEQFPAVISRIVGGEAIQTVNARDLHDFLQVGKDFSTWVKDRIEQYGFVQGQDFEVFPEIGGNPSGGRPAKEYAISIDMAKELSMVERNEQGKKARRHFIECERIARGVRASAAQRAPAPRNGQLSPSHKKVRYAKMRLAHAVAELDDLGVNVAAIDIGVVLNFARAVL